MSYSVTEPSNSQKWFAGILVVSYALITLMPLAWIIATGFKSSADSIAYPPKVVFEPSVEGYVNLFTTQTRISDETIAETQLLSALAQLSLRSCSVPSRPMPFQGLEFR